MSEDWKNLSLEKKKVFTIYFRNIKICTFCLLNNMKRNSKNYKK